MPSDAWCSVLPAGSGLPVTNRTCCFVESPFLLSPLAKKEESLFRKSRCFLWERKPPSLPVDVFLFSKTFGNTKGLS